MQQLKLRCFFSCGRLYSFSPSSSLNQPAMKTISSLPGLRGSAGSLPWPQSSGFLWVPFTHCGCYLAHSCRWCTFTIYLFPPQDITGDIHVNELPSHEHIKSSSGSLLLVRFSHRNWSCPSHHTPWMKCQKRHIMRGEETEKMDIQP